MVTVKVTETYDLKTTVGKLGILGVHTPDLDLVRRLYPGLLKSHKFMRFLKCDVVGACASVLPADPLQVGVTAGAVAPEDMFNPILYKAVTNESFDTLVSRVMRAGADVTGASSLAQDEIQITNADTTFRTYYGLLAENGAFRKAMPQSGFRISNLVPICHTLVSNYGNLSTIENIEVTTAEEDLRSVPDLTATPYANDTLSSMNNTYDSGIVFRGKPVRMPRLPIHSNGKLEAWDEIPDFYTVKTMVACLIIPPAKLHEFFYRVRITWWIRFEEICSTIDAGNATAISRVGNVAYAQGYTYSKSNETLDNQDSSIDSQNVEISKIMES